MWVAFLFALLIILLAAVWDLATDQAEQRVRAEKSAQYHIEYAEDRIDKECLSLEPDALRDCIHKEIESARDHDRANQDLAAQQKMALFTKIMGITAIFGLVLGGLSIVLIFGTLREMSDTNRIMRDEQRPWLVMDKQAAPYSILGRMYRSTPKTGLRISVTNKGRLPAKNAIATYIIFSSDTVSTEEASLAIERALFASFEYSTLPISTVFQGEETEISVVPLPSGMRVHGQGVKWSVMIACLYYWEEKLKWVWSVTAAQRPPENVLRKIERQ